MSGSVLEVGCTIFEDFITPNSLGCQLSNDTPMGKIPEDFPLFLYHSKVHTLGFLGFCRGRPASP